MSLSQANPYWYELSPQSICILCKGVGMGASLTFRNFLLLLLIKKIIKNRKFEFYLIVLWISAAEPHLHIFSNIFGTHRTISFKFYENNLRRAIKQLFWVLYTKSKSLQRNMLKQSMTSPLFVRHTSDGLMIKPTHAVKAWTPSFIYPLRNNLRTQRIAYGNELQWVISTTALQTTPFLLL